MWRERPERLTQPSPRRPRRRPACRRQGQPPEGAASEGRRRRHAHARPRPAGTRLNRSRPASPGPPPPPAGTTSPSSPGRATPRRGRRGGCWGSRERGGRQRPAVRGSGWPEGTPSPRVLGGSVCLNRCQWAPAAAGKASRTREGFSPAPPPPGFPEHQRLGAA